MSVLYLNPEDVINTTRTFPPNCYSRTGYGSKLPTPYMLQLKDKRWRRVYVMCWSNKGSAYIKTKKDGTLFLGQYEHELKSIQ